MTEKKPLSSAIEFSFHETPVAQAEGGSLHEHADTKFMHHAVCGYSAKAASKTIADAEKSRFLT